MPQVVIEQPGVPPMTVPLDNDEVSFGRSEENDVVLVADEVSRHHARIVRRGDLVVLFDNKSLNGTYVNRQRIVERVLTHMDELWFGSKCRLVYRDDTKLGRKESTERPENSSKTIKNMDKIRAEMERVSVSMIGKAAESAPANIKTIAPQANEDEMMKMGRAFRRLDALWRASNIMASDFDLRQRLVSVLDLVIELLGADRGFVMLREPGTHNLNVKVARAMGRELEASSPSMGIAGRAAIDGEPVLMNDRPSGQHEFSARESIIQSAILSAMCVPLRVQDKLIGSIYVDSSRQGITFSDEDLELFAAVAAQAAVAIDHLDQHDRLMEAARKQADFSRFLSPDVVEKIMQEGTEIELGGQKATATTMFCDIRGFTNISESLSPQEIVHMLNEHFTAVTEIIFELKGTINKFIGDEIMCVFGAPFAIGDEEIRAVEAGLLIQRRVAELNFVREREGRPVFLVGVGIETGEVSAGYIGSPMRMEYTVIGDRVNVASRLCSKAQPGQVVVGPNTWEKVKDRVLGNPIGEFALKGKTLPVLLHEVTALK